MPRIFIHMPEAEIVIYDARPDESVKALCTRYASSDAHAYIVGECDELSHSMTVGEAGISEETNLLVSTCLKVDVEVVYNGRPETQNVSPATTAAEIIAWASDKFEVPEDTRAKLQLTVDISGQKYSLSRDEPIGKYTATDCKISTYLHVDEGLAG